MCSSSLGAVSLAFCKTCLENGAEPEFALVNTLYCCGDSVHPSIKDISTFVDGHYMKWEEWLARGRELVAEFEKGIAALEHLEGPSVGDPFSET